MSGSNHAAQDRARKAVHALGRGSMRNYFLIFNNWVVIIMSIELVQTLIGSLGFPIACVIAMFWMWNKEREDHKQEVNKMTEALNNNTQALIKIEELLRHE